MSVKWTLNSVIFEINPSSVTISRLKRFHVLEIINGDPVYQQGRDEVPTMSLQCSLLTQTAYVQFNDWFETGGVLTMVDDNSVSYSVIIESMDFERRHSASHQHYYVGTFILRILSGL